MLGSQVLYSIPEFPDAFFPYKVTISVFAVSFEATQVGLCPV